MILNIYKPMGWTSYDIVAKIKVIIRPLGKKIKIGHAGTLDPLAEGILIVLLGNDTKKQDEIMKMPKEYVCEIGFGATSPTYDLEMPLSYSNVNNFLKIEDDLNKLLSKYIGEQYQTVPPYSAVKQSGTPLYKKARKNKISDITLPKKKITIYEIDKLDFYQKERLSIVKLRVLCSKGTYIRSLAHDLGEDLGIGGVMTSLIRTKVGEYKVADSLRIEELNLDHFKEIY